MPAPWVAGAQARIIGEIHGQETVNVLNFATNSAIADQAALDTLLLQLAAALLDCAVTTLIPAVTQDWKVIRTDARRIHPTASDPIVATANAGEAQIANSAIDAGTLTALAAFAACLASKFMGGSATTDWRLGVLSRKNLISTGGTFDNSFREATSLNPVAKVSVLRSRKVA